MKIQYSKKNLLINGKPTVLMIAEYHYFRNDPEVWESTIKKIKSIGCDGIAAYMPWLIHEEFPDEFDFTGEKNPRLNLVGFLDLVKKHDLYLIARPGPFVMAEMKNDGIPYWVKERHPEILPITWEAKAGTTMTLDYLAPAFLKESRHWYENIMPVLKRYQGPDGNLVGIQIDNEVGMLSWVSNNPDLNDFVLNQFAMYLTETYSKDDLAKRYPFKLDGSGTYYDRIRRPIFTYVNELHRDLGLFMRNRYRRYIHILREYMIDLGIDTTFLINIHGTGGGRALEYPIGISQLFESFRDEPDMIAGSDVYLDDVGVESIQDIYMANILTDAVNSGDQPLTSLEFSAGDGNYSESLTVRYQAARTDLMTRIFMAQDNRLLNFYTFVGGTNYRFETLRGDGNDRISTTGEGYGFAAPISPNQKENYTFSRMAQAILLFHNYRYLLGTVKQVTDPVVNGFIPDYFMTEASYPKYPNAIFENLKKYRSRMFWDSTIKSLNLLNFNFKAVDLQSENPPVDKLLIMPSARYMAKTVQNRLIKFLEAGGKLLLYGEVPFFDMEGGYCTDLIDYLGIKILHDAYKENRRKADSIISTGYLGNRPEVHRSFFQTISSQFDHEVLLKVYDLDQSCGIDIHKGQARAVIITCDYITDLTVYGNLMEHLGISKKIGHSNYELHGIFLSVSKAGFGEFITIANLDDFDKDVDIIIDNRVFLPNQRITANQGYLLLKNVELYPGLRVIRSNCEITDFTDNSLTIRLNGDRFYIELDTEKNPIPDQAYEYIRSGRIVTITKNSRLTSEQTLVIRFADK